MRASASRNAARTGARLGAALLWMAAAFAALASPSLARPRDHMRTLGRRGDRVIYRRGFVLGVGVNIIEANLRDPDVRIAAMVARGGIGHAESFASMVRRARPTAAITGTFFSLRSREPTGDLVINGRNIFRGFIGTAVAITQGNLVTFIKTRYKDTSVDWSLYDTVIRGGPRLLDQGRLTVAPRREGFRTLPVRSRRRRTAVGVTRDSRLLLVAVRQGITLYELAKVMHALKAYHAVALDGGTSTAMYFAGRTIARPGRGLTNALLIYDRRAEYERALPHFAGPQALPRPAARTSPLLNPSAGLPGSDAPRPEPDRPGVPPEGAAPEASDGQAAAH
ncbi:MAG: phosphodiester glycosidase family protein [Armatimonadetes bacterium]|nr:phosphodiester glycosidase family protein [Armatimonadota bacterium]